jgi:hypothetical protein
MNPTQFDQRILRQVQGSEEIPGGHAKLKDFSVVRKNDLIDCGKKVEYNYSIR